MRVVNIPWLVLSIIIAVVVKLMIIIHITMTSHGRHVVSNHRSFDCLFNSEYVPTSKKHQSPHYCSFVREIHRMTVEFFAAQMPSNAERLPYDEVIRHTRHQAITRANYDPDLCRQLASPGHNGRIGLQACTSSVLWIDLGFIWVWQSQRDASNTENLDTHFGTILWTARSCNDANT